jgi:WS/DGAT/MGAT family acyltransferase
MFVFDGQAAVALANLLLDLSPTPRTPAPRGAPRAAPFAPGMTEMLRGALAQQASKIAQIVRELPATAGTLKDAALVAAARSPRLGGAGSGANLSLAPRTLLNGTVGRSRAFATARVPLDPLKRIGRAHGATVNDMVLLLCSGALRRVLMTRKSLPRKSLVAAVPVSLRAADDAEAGNRASLTLVSLGTHLADPWRRLAHIVAASADMKSTLGAVKRVLPTDFPSLGVPWLMEAAAALYGKARVAERLPLLANVVISNVPGPPITLYLAGARLLASHPTSIVVHGLALNITVQGYDGALDFGLMADGEAMPDVRALADALHAAFDELVALQGDDGTEAAQAPSLTTLARRGLGQAVGAAAGVATRTARGVVGGVVDSAWRGVVRQVSGGNTAGRRRKGGR